MELQDGSTPDYLFLYPTAPLLCECPPFWSETGGEEHLFPFSKTQDDSLAKVERGHREPRTYGVTYGSIPFGVVLALPVTR